MRKHTHPPGRLSVQKRFASMRLERQLFEMRILGQKPRAILEARYRIPLRLVVRGMYLPLNRGNAEPVSSRPITPVWLLNEVAYENEIFVRWLSRHLQFTRR